MKKKWFVFTSHFHNRTENAIKNRFHLLMSKIKKENEENLGKNEESLLIKMLEILKMKYPKMEYN